MVKTSRPSAALGSGFPDLETSIILLSFLRGEMDGRREKGGDEDKMDGGLS